MRDFDEGGACLVDVLSRMLITFVLAYKMAKIVWASMAEGGSYRASAAA